MCKFCYALEQMQERAKTYPDLLIHECAIVEGTVLHGPGGEKFPLFVSNNDGPKSFNGFPIRFCPECGRNMREDNLSAKGSAGS